MFHTFSLNHTNVHIPLECVHFLKNWLRFFQVTILWNSDKAVNTLTRNILRLADILILYTCPVIQKPLGLPRVAMQVHETTSKNQCLTGWWEWEMKDHNRTTGREQNKVFSWKALKTSEYLEFFSIFHFRSWASSFLQVKVKDADAELSRNYLEKPPHLLFARGGHYAAAT